MSTHPRFESRAEIIAGAVLIAEAILGLLVHHAHILSVNRTGYRTQDPAGGLETVSGRVLLLPAGARVRVPHSSVALPMHCSGGVSTVQELFGNLAQGKEIGVEELG